MNTETPVIEPEVTGSPEVGDAQASPTAKFRVTCTKCKETWMTNKVRQNCPHCKAHSCLMFVRQTEETKAPEASEEQQKMLEALAIRQEEFSEAQWAILERETNPDRKLKIASEMIGFNAQVMQIEHLFTYHSPASENQIQAYEDLRSAAKSFAMAVIHLTPVSADQLAAIRKIREALMTAKDSIACAARLRPGGH